MSDHEGALFFLKLCLCIRDYPYSGTPGTGRGWGGGEITTGLFRGGSSAMITCDLRTEVVRLMKAKVSCYFAH